MKPLYRVYCSTPIFWRSSIQRYLEEGAWTPICCWHQNELLPQAIQHTIGLPPHGVGCSVITSEQVCIECFLVLTHWDTNAVIDLWQPVTCTKTRHWPWPMPPVRQAAASTGEPAGVGALPKAGHSRDTTRMRGALAATRTFLGCGNGGHPERALSIATATKGRGLLDIPLVWQTHSYDTPYISLLIDLVVFHFSTKVIL